MARGKLGHIFASISGHIQGLTIQQGLSGTILRRTPHKCKSSSAYAQLVQFATQYTQSLWVNLLPSQQAEWKLYAQFAAKVQKHNPGHSISGQACFFQINFYRFIYGSTILLTPVFDLTKPTDLDPLLTYSGGQLVFSLGRLAVIADELLIFKLTCPLGSSINNCENKLKIMLSPTMGSNTQIQTSQYIVRFGKTPVAGLRIGWAITSHSLVNGSFLPWYKGITTI